MITMDSQFARTLIALEDGKARTSHEIAELTGMQKVQASSSLNRLYNRGEVSRIKRGKGQTGFRYTITGTGRTLLAGIRATNQPADPTPEPEGSTVPSFPRPTDDELAATHQALLDTELGGDDYEQGPGEQPEPEPVRAAASPAASADTIKVTVEIVSGGERHNYRATHRNATADDARVMAQEVAAEAIDAAFTSQQ